MQIIKGGKALGHMPNGTVFSILNTEVLDENPTIFSAPADICGLHIIVGHDKTSLFSPEGGHFNGVIHMLDYIQMKHDGTIDDEMPHSNEDFCDCCIDTTEWDYGENTYFLIYDKETIEKIINNLTDAIRGNYE